MYFYKKSAGTYLEHSYLKDEILVKGQIDLLNIYVLPQEVLSSPNINARLR